MNYIERYKEIRHAQTNDHKCVPVKVPKHLSDIAGVDELYTCRLCGKVVK